MPRRSALVLGASGFLGSRVTERLAGREWDVLGIDRVAPKSSGRDRGARHMVFSLPSPRLRTFITAAHPEAIIFAAGTSSVAASIEAPAADFSDSVVVLHSVLDAVWKLRADTKVLFLSSAAVYGNQDRLPIREDATPDPVSPYGYHKLLSEILLEDYSRNFGVRSCALRIFSAYGPGLKRQLMWDICRKAAAEKTVVLDGTGQETRDFVHCDDIARAVETLIDRAPFHAEKYNLASGKETSVRDVATGLIRAMGMERPIRFTGNQRPGDPLRWRADITSIRRLGFVPKVTLVRGLTGYAKWALAEKGLHA